MLNQNYLELVKSQLAQFASQADFETVLTTAFGSKIDKSKIFQLRQQWLKGDFSIIPPVEILTHGELNNANGGYSASEDKIFVSSDFLARNQGNSNTITGLLLEEIGHKIDRFFNGDIDSAGDEGDIFSRLVSGQTLSAQTLALLKAEDDTAVIIVDGKVVSIEQQNIYGTNGDDILNGDRNGVVANDYIEGIGGNDQLYGKGGNDILDGGDGNDRLDGGDGNDHLYGGRGDDSIYSGTGADIIDGKITTDFIVINSGKDYLYIANYGDTANTTIKYTAVSDGKITGGSNNGTTFKNIDSVSFATGSGNDIIDISAASTGGVYNYNYVSACAGNDSIIGGLNAANYLYGGDGKDYIDGNGNGSNFLSGGTGNDYILGGSGNDSVYGDEGDDVIRAGKGADFIDGGAGNDLIDIYNYGDTANISIDYFYSDKATITNGSNNGTTFTNIESGTFVTGSGSDYINLFSMTGDNYIDTGAGDDSIYTSMGNDIIYAGKGDDGIIIRAGADTIDGEDGKDLLQIYSDDDTVNTNISYTTATNGKITGGLNNGTTFNNIETIYVNGGSGNDSIDITAAAGNNYVHSDAGNDSIYTGAGVDRIYAGTGDDFISSGTGADIIDGEAGKDRIYINNSTYAANISIVNTTATNGTITGGFNNGTTFKNIESGSFTTGFGNDFINISASKGDNTVFAGSGNDTIYGGSGNDYIDASIGKDTIFTGAGNDSIVVYAGTDNIDGGIGKDRLTINNGFDTVNTTTIYRTANDGTIAGGSSNGTAFKNIESVDLTAGSAYDYIDVSAATGDNYINAGGGDDIIVTSIGNDTIYGGSGNDVIDSGTGTDILDGGAGNDKFYIRNNSGTANTTITYLTATSGKISGGSNNGTTFKNIEAGVIWTGAGNDKIDLAASAGDNYIESGAGNDNIYGGSGNDEINAGKGADVINGGGGKDLLEIGNYYDPNLDTANTTIIYTSSLNGTVTGGSNNGTTFKNIERIRAATGSGNDKIDISAATGNNSINANAGNDTLIGGVGNDRLYGGTGNDTMRGGAGNDFYSVDSASDIVIENANGGNDTIYSTSVNYTLVLNVEELILSGSANGTGNSGDNFIYGEELLLPKFGNNNNVINGGGGNDTLRGGAGNDTLNGGTGNDILNGGTGNDIFLFNGGALTGAVTVAALLGKDTIADFKKVAGNQDKIVLSKGTFTAIKTTTVGGSVLANFATVSVVDDVLGRALAGASSAAIVYNTATGSLFYNQDGTTAGLGTNGGIFATLTTKPLLAASDFSIIA
jgi:Ca2+-binding RTX toxin-like protein